ncbi:MAG: hypothetical protein P8X95_25770 [Anaerolineales bacterium]
MHDAAATGHPLHVAGADDAHVADAVAVADVALQHVGDGFNAAVGMGGKANRGAFDGIVESKMVKQEKGVEGVGPAGPKGAQQAHAGAFDDHLRFDNLFYFTVVVWHEGKS